MKKYVTPDFDVTVYEIEDVITASIVGKDPDDNGEEEFFPGAAQ